MHQVTTLISLGDDAYRLAFTEEARRSLQEYLDRAAVNLKADPDHDEVLNDLERSIGERLTSMIQDEARPVLLADVQAVVEQVGAVEAGDARAEGEAAPGTQPVAAASSQRRLWRVRQGEQLAGVCMGLSEYADIRVDWVRTIFVLLAIFTGGLFLLVYIGMMFTVPPKPVSGKLVSGETASRGSRDEAPVVPRS